MGLFNHLFGSTKSIAREIINDDKKRIALWERHLSDFQKRESLARHFNHANIDNALLYFEATKKVLRHIEKLILQDIVNADDEGKTDKEILGDLARLKENHEIERLHEVVLSSRQKQKTLLVVFGEILKVLRAELHLIRAIMKKPSRDLLLSLFRIIFFNEANLYKIFRAECFGADKKHIHADIIRVARAIILEQEVEELMETDEEKFARKMVRQMAPHESKRRYRKLGEDIFLALAEKVGAPMPRGEDITKGIKRMERLMAKDDVMYVIVKNLRSKYNDSNIKGVILAFRNAYGLGHFEELESEFAT